MTTKRERITTKALELLKENSAGLRFSELVAALKIAIPGEPEGNYTGSIWNLDARYPTEVFKPSRGLFRLTKYRDEEILPELPKEPTKLKEEHFYQPFAECLVRDLEECTTAIPLGGNLFKEKWGTPDVFGVFKARESDIVKMPIEVVVAEIKIDASQLITAYGQACAYKLFAHKSYLVVPQTSSKEDIDRLDALCIISGIGLILFDAANEKSAGFRIRVRASKHEPDAFYVNNYLRRIADQLSL